MRKLTSKLAGQQSGFTLIELVIVIVVIGILAAVAIPQFANVSDDAKNAKADATLGAMASWAATNYARCQGKLNPPALAEAGCNTATLSAAMGATVGSAALDEGGKCVVTLTEGGTSNATADIKVTPASCS